jgi:hypothetical protein
LDGIARQSSARWLARLLFIEASEGGDNSNGAPGTTANSNLADLNLNTADLPAPAPAAQVAAVIRTLSAAGADVLLADRRSGKIFAGGQARAILAAAEARALDTGKDTGKDTRRAGAVPGGAA